MDFPSATYNCLGQRLHKFESDVLSQEFIIHTRGELDYNFTNYSFNNKHVLSKTHTHFFAKNAGSAAAAVTECKVRNCKTDLKSRTGALSEEAGEAKNSCALKWKMKST